MDQAQVTGFCEKAVGFSYSGPKPFLIRCGKVGKLVKGALKPFGVFICEDHLRDGKGK